MSQQPAGKPSVGRRKFLKSAAVVGGTATASLIGGHGVAGAERAPTPEQPQRSGPAPLMPADSDPPPEPRVLTVDHAGSDFMVDVLKALGFEYVAANPGSAFRGLHESIVNYGGNKAPELLTCCHEESSVALAHGYAAVEGKPMLVMAHSTVGLQHASMAIYNAYSGGVPVFIIVGNTLDATMRRPGAEWYHSVVDAAAMVRDYTKWDDNPVSLNHFAESSMRAYKFASTFPKGPVLLVADSELQEREVEKGAQLRIPKLTLERPPQADSGAVAEAARLLVAAANPVIVAGDAVHTQEGMALLVELAELLQAPVQDQGGNFPSQHRLNGGGRGAVQEADVVLGLDMDTMWSTVNTMTDQVHRPSRSLIKDGAKLITIGTYGQYSQGNYQNLQRYQAVDLAMSGDSQATMPSLIEAIRKLMTADRKSAFDQRGARIAAARERAQEQARRAATYGWDASPVSVARLSAEVWAQIKDEDWALAGNRGGPTALWNFTKRYQRLMGGDATGIGFTAPSSVGAALAHRKHGRLSVCIQTDGDLMYAPGVLWTAAHHRIPILSVMHNNRAYHQEVMHLQRMSTRRQRDVTTSHVGNVLWDPFINYKKLAESMGVYSEGPIENPNDLGPALKRAIAVVKRGEPALVDVVTQPR
jgi:acetolactate synthase I/II/III large subunit